MELHSNDKGMSLFSDFIAAHCHNISLLSFPGGSDRKKIHYPLQKKKKKESTWNVGDLGSISGLGRSPGEGNSYPLQYSGLESSTDRGAWRATVHGVAKSRHD